MKHLAFVTIAALAGAPVFAGVRILSENTDLTTKKVTTDTILLDTNRMRVESDDGGHMMFLSDGGRDRIVVLDKARNTYQEIDDAR